MKRLTPWFAIALLVGCHADDRVRVYSVEGELQIGGKPAAGALLTFYGTGGDTRAPIPFAVVGPDGKFRVTTYAANDGAPEGEYRVGVVWPPAGAPRSGDDRDDGTGPPDQLRGRYAAPTKSPLRATVTPGETKLAPFRLD